MAKNGHFVYIFQYEGKGIGKSNFIKIITLSMSLIQKSLNFLTTLEHIFFHMPNHKNLLFL